MTAPRRHTPEASARFFLATLDGLTMQHLALPDATTEPARLQALLSAIAALARG
ncbi:hypothetical protein [Streptomyces cyaneochromogenes]|uniref:hypothetical protein n=1 Tax=Streptomyces cyaneochromogenes TaxID=2496836 RepID=UPI00158D2963|nr:hypothetical protein [Streptomyces cyaneochromogenes]